MVFFCLFVCLFFLSFWSFYCMPERRKGRRASLKPQSRFVHVALNTSLHVILDLFVLL